MKLKYLLFIITIFTFNFYFSQDSLQEKVYIFKDLNVTGTAKYSKTQVMRFTGLYQGKSIRIPGQDIGNAIRKLWNTNLFSNVEFFVGDVIGDEIILTAKLTPLPDLGEITIEGLSKGKREKFIKEHKLSPGTKITDDLKKKFTNSIVAFYDEKGFSDAKVTIKETPNAKDASLVDWNVSVDKGNKVKIDAININDNKELSDSRVRAQMKNTKQKNIIRFWKSSKFIPEKYKEDLAKITDEYNSLGFRDAKIVSEKVTKNPNGNLTIDVNLNEGKRYFLGNVNFVGNTVFTTEALKKYLGYKKGDPYDAVGINKKISGSEKDDDLYTLYTDNGYLFVDITPIEKSVINDTINLEIRISEKEKATWNRVTFSGNDTTHDHVIQRVLGTRSGDLFSKSEVKSTLYQLAGLGYFEPQEIEPKINPNPATNTADIHWKLAEKGSSQIELQGGYGGGRFIGTLGLTFNNFSLSNLLKGKWNGIIPQGDGQQISLRAQAGNNYQNYSISFMEPWISGKRPTSLSISFYYTMLNSYYNNADANLDILGASVGLNKNLTKPDNYFKFSNGFAYQLYRFQNYPFNFGTVTLNDGQSNNFNYFVSFGRYSAGVDPVFPQYGSEFEIAAKLTPPYSLINGKNYATMTTADKYQWLEYYKIKAKAYWYQELVDKVVIKVGGEFGYLGAYNNEVGLPPFERFFLGGTGLAGNRFDGREIIPLRGYEDATNQGGSPRVDITPTGGGSIYNKYLMELRYPITLSQTAKIYGLAFLEAGNTWNDSKEFKPFEVKRSAGLGIRIFMPAFGMIGFDFGYGFDKVLNASEPSGWQTHFIIGQQF